MTSTTLDELRSLIGNPSMPRWVADWSSVEQGLGSRLPPDYKEMVEEYPILCFDQFLTTHHPGAIGFYNLGSAAQWILEDARELGQEFDEIPYPLFPEQEGIFPWASTKNGDHVFWLPVGEPELWTVVVAGRDYTEDDWWHFPGTATEFLLALATRRTHCPIFSENSPEIAFTIEQHELKS